MKKLDPKHPAYKKVQAAEKRLERQVENAKRLEKEREESVSVKEMHNVPARDT